MRAAVINDDHEFELRSIPDPKPEPDQVLVKVAACGICGSDIHMRNSGIVFPGMVMGHEMGGTIVELGAQVADTAQWKVGDEVAVMPVLPCGKCPSCASGKPQVCADQHKTAMGLGVRQGGLAEFVTVWPRQLFKLPEDVPAYVGALAEPLAVGFHGVDRSQIEPDDRAVVLGGGSIGVMTSLGLKASGVDEFVVSEPSEQRRDTLDALGVEAVSPQKIAGKITGPDVVFDTTGVGTVLSDAVQIVKPGGTVMLMGVVETPTQVFPVLWVVKEIDVRSVLAYGDSFPDAVTALGDGRVDTTTLSADRVPLGETEATMQLLATANAPPKILIDPAA